MGSEELAIRKAIAEQPWQDAPRLAYADWLREHGREAQADFIQIQMKCIETFTQEHHGGYLFSKPSPESWELHKSSAGIMREQVDKTWLAGDRDKVIKDRPNLRLIPDMFYGLRLHPDIHCGTSVLIATDAEEGTGHGKFQRIEFHFRRGLVDGVRGPLAAIYSNARYLFAVHPIRYVRLTDRTITLDTAQYLLACGGDQTYSDERDTNIIPKPVMGEGVMNVSFSSAGVGRDWLSRRIIAWGRDYAGVNPISELLLAESLRAHSPIVREIPEPGGQLNEDEDAEDQQANERAARNDDWGTASHP